jgi:hypothetical protein
MLLRKKPIYFSFATAASLAILPLQAEEKVASEFTEMVTDGTVNLDFRYRYEHVDDDGVEKHANASTLRSRLTFASAIYKGVSFLVEVDNVTSIGDDDYNSTENGKTEYAVVADPEGTAANQTWLKYNYEALTGILGRQRIIYDRQRFVGGVAWRQNEQTYDGFRGQWQGPHGLSLDAAYVDTVNRIFGPDDGPVQPAQLEGDNYFVHGGWKVNEEHALSAFAYILDIDDDEKYDPGKSVNNSTDTYGLEYAGKFGPISAKAAYARQSDGGDSSLDYDANYYMLEGGITFVGVNAHVGYEVLESDSEVGFKTPYATLHKFQGWADKFLATPNDGIEDIYAGLSGEIGPVKLQAIYHDFQAQDSGTDFGSEIDLAATWPVNKMWTLQLKYADFDTDDESRYKDTEKIWAVVHFKY